MNLENIFDKLSPSEKKQLYEYLRQLDETQAVSRAQVGFMDFVRLVWPSFVLGRHHAIMAAAFEQIANGTLKRLIINLPPRHSKSELSSYLFPAWFLGKYPHKKVIQASNTAELAVRFGRKVRNLIATDTYQRVFPGTKLTQDSRAAGRWDTAVGGEYFAIGAEGTISGRGADLYVIDDPHSEKEALMAPNDPEIFDKVYEWFTSGPRQRLQPGGAICIIMTRWGARDLTGRVLGSGSAAWKVIELPAIMPSGVPLWPEFWPIEELLAVKEDIPPQKWSAQYQQRPVSEEVAIVKPGSWQRWKDRKLPKMDFIIQSWDTALLTTERSNASACTTWGVFTPNEDSKTQHIMLLDALEAKLDFVELKRRAMGEYRHWKPDCLIIEAKAAGSPLIDELRSQGLPVVDFTPTRGQSKLARINAIADLFSSRIVWAPEGNNYDRVIQQMSEFPHGDADDLVDTTTQALLRFRAGGFVRLASDFDDEKNKKLTARFNHPEYY